MIDLSLELSQVKTVGITGHIRPDGDCVGSTMGLYNYIFENYPNVAVYVFLEECGDEFSYIPNIRRIRHEADEDIKLDLCIVLDCSAIDRIEPFAAMFHGAKKTICIDHHVSNEAFAMVNEVVSDASSTCEVLYHLLKPELISKEVAECLYTGIIHDTGVFKYSCTSKETMAIAGELMEKGIDYSYIIDNSFYKKTYVQNQILGRALLESVLFFNGKCIFSVLRKKDLDFYGVCGRDLGGIIEQLRLTDGVEVAIFIYETGVHEYKVSMRSKNYIDVSKICVLFGGGGHVRAAGCTMTGSPHDIINNLGAQIELQFKKLGAEFD